MGEWANTIMIVGSGQTGTAIAKIAAGAGYTVLLQDLEQERVDKSIGDIETQLTSEGVDEREQKEILSRIQPTLSLKESVQSDFVIETATENLTIKKQIFTILSNYITKDTILATNTSALSITEIASASDCPERVVGMHFMSPVSTMNLVEIVRGAKTTDRTLDAAQKIVTSLDKVAIEVKDYPGFICNRLIIPMINEAITCVFDDIAEVETIDRIMQLGLKHPIGPLRLADTIGLDTCLAVMETLHRSLENRKYRPCALLRNMVKAGKLGRKSGEGFYRYD
jgi:3-hydroxybutyryl-CoA dehydrogenase